MTSRNWTRRTVIGACLAAGATPLVRGATGMSAEGAQLRAAAQPQAVIDPAYEIGPPLPPGDAGKVVRLPRADARRLLPRGESTAGEGERSTQASAALPFQFRYTDFEVRELPESIRPDRLETAVPLVDTGVHDASGVRMIHFGGKLQDHPVAQCHYGMSLMESFRITGNVEYLNRAKKQAQRLVDRKIVEKGGWFYPYPFRYGVHRIYEVLEAPWFSMMAQGRALSLFVMLTEATGEGTWREAADATFASFLVAPVARRPWGVYTVDGLLWLEEYVSTTAIRGDRTYNGHNFGAYGLYAYWLMTKDPTAKLLLQGAMTTARDVYAQIRRRGWRGNYCLTHKAEATGGYHDIHIAQHLQWFAITGDTSFAKTAELYYWDFPMQSGPGSIRFGAGAHTGYKFDATGRITASHRINLTRRSAAPADHRLKVLRQSGLWYTVTAGTLKGYHLREVPGHSHMVGVHARYGYRVPRPAQVATAPVWAYAVAAGGGTTATQTEYRAGDAVTISARGAVNGVDHVQLESGPYAEQWVPATAIALI